MTIEITQEELAGLNAFIAGKQLILESNFENASNIEDVTIQKSVKSKIKEEIKLWENFGKKINWTEQEKPNPYWSK